MNILITVFTILMMLAALTYARLETFIDFSTMRSVQREYMRGTERKVYNTSQLQLYQESLPSQKETPPMEVEDPSDNVNYYSENAEVIKEEILDKKQKSDNLLSYIDWNILVNMQEGDNKELFDKTFELSKRLILLLYGEQHFFKEATEKYPDLETLVLQKMIEGAHKLRNEKKITRKKDLAEISFADEDLRVVYYKMMKGTRSKKDRKIPGYPPLTDFITISSNKPLSVYLAPQEVLLAIFEAPEVVDQILKERQEIFRGIAGGIDPKSGEQRFQSEFEGKVPTHFRGNLLNFKISKTNPAGYN